MQPTPAFTAHDLTGFDWFLVILVAVSVLLAFQRGFVKVLFSFAGLVAGIVLAAWNYARLALMLQRWIASSPAAQVVAFLAILFVITMFFSLAAGLARKTLSAAGLGIFDRLLGAGFGLLRGVLLGVAVMMAISAFVPGSPWLKNSRLTPYFLAGAHAVSFVVPRRFEEQMAAGAKHLLQQTPERTKPRNSSKGI